jgi:hypothetical protein
MMTISAVPFATHNAWQRSILSTADHYEVHVPSHAAYSSFKQLDKAALAARQAGSAQVYAVDANGRHVLIEREKWYTNAGSLTL